MPVARAGPLDAQLWEGAGPEDQQRIQYDVGQTAGQQGRHGDLHPAHRLEDLLIGQPQGEQQGEAEYRPSVPHPQRQHLRVLGEHFKEGGEQGDGQAGQDHSVDRAEGQPMDRGRTGPVPALRPQIEGDGRVQPHSEADG